MVAVLVMILCCILCGGQQSPTEQPAQQPKTAPQQEQILTSYEGQNVTSVSLAGRPDLNTDQFTPVLLQRAGEKFSLQKVRSSAEALKKAGGFETVRLRVEPEPNGVSVRFVLEPAMYYGLFQFTGAVKQFGYARLVQISNYPPRGAYDNVDVQRAADALVKFYNRNGYFLAEVTPRLQVDHEHGLVSVDFDTKLGRQAKFGTVNIEGPTPEETAHLRNVLHSFLARLRGSAIRPGKTYKLKTLQNATQYLDSSLQKQDRLAAQVRLVGAKYNPDNNRADITFNVQTGPVVHVKVEGAHLWSWTRHKLLPLYAGIGVDPEVIQEGRQNLVSYFENKGYFNVNVTSHVQQQENGESIVYQITKGPRHKVESVKIAGNQQFSSDQLAPYLKVKKKRLLNHGDFSQKLVNASVKNIQDFYKANGYSSVKVTPQVANAGRNIAVAFNVDEGPRDIVESLNIQGNDTFSESRFAPHGLKLVPGQPYSQKFADQDRNEIMAHYLNAGYLNASFRETVKQVPNQTHRLIVTYQINEGPQVSTASFITLGRSHTKQKLINRSIASIKPGHALTERDLYTSQTVLYNNGVFDWAEIDPRREITTQTKEDVVVKLHEAPRNQLTYGFGFEVINRGGSIPSGTVVVPGLPAIGLNKNFKTAVKTFYGPRATIQYTRNNLRGKDESLTFAGFVGRLDQRVAIAYINPSLRWSKWGQDVGVSGETNQANPIFSSRLVSVGYDLKRPLDPNKTQNLILRYRYQQQGISRLTIPELVPPQDRHIKLSMFSINYVRDTRDNALDAHKGIYQSYEATIVPRALGSSVDFGRFFGQMAYYKKIVANIIWANSLRLGLEAPFAGSHVPITEQYFTGGGSTLRGFSLYGAGPQHFVNVCGTNECFPTLVPVGGNQLFILNSEMRIPVDQIKKGLGVVAFYDGGNVYSHVGFDDFLSTYTNSIGFGLRYSTPVGPIRIDIGHVLNLQPSIIGAIPPGVTNPTNAIKRTNYFITIGQAF